jgi:hypothetical protein
VQLKGGRHVRYAKETPLANLHLTLLDKLGVHLDRIGDSTGRPRRPRARGDLMPVAGPAMRNAFCAATMALACVTGLSAATDLRLIDAVKSRDLERVRALVKERVDVNARQGDGATALHWAVHRDDLDAVDLLIAAGAKADVADDTGATPLHLACVNRRASVVERLLASGANPNATLVGGETVLMTCARAGEPAAVRALLRRGADVNAKEPSA